MWRVAVAQVCTRTVLEYSSKVCAACIDLPKDAGLLDLLVICVGHEQLVPISASSLALCTPFLWSIYVSVQGYCTAGTMGTLRSVRPARLILFTSSLALSVRRFSSKYVSAKDAATVDLWILRVNPDLLAPLSPPAPRKSVRYSPSSDHLSRLLLATSIELDDVSPSKLQWTVASSLHKPPSARRSPSLPKTNLISGYQRRYRNLSVLVRRCVLRAHSSQASSSWRRCRGCLDKRAARWVMKELRHRLTRVKKGEEDRDLVRDRFDMLDPEGFVLLQLEQLLRPLDLPVRGSPWLP